MPQKAKISKEDIVRAAVELVRREGTDALGARNIAAFLGCSTQPIFSNFASMDELKMAVVEKANLLCKEYIEAEMAKQEFPAYKANGMAYIRFAREEKQLFRLLYMRDRSREDTPERLEFENDIASVVQETTGLDRETASLFHLEMWAFVHGIATMLATGFLNLERELVSAMITDIYKGLRKQYQLEEN